MPEALVDLLFIVVSDCRYFSWSNTLRAYSKLSAFALYGCLDGLLTQDDVQGLVRLDLGDVAPLELDLTKVLALYRYRAAILLDHTPSDAIAVLHDDLIAQTRCGDQCSGHHTKQRSSHRRVLPLYLATMTQACALFSLHSFEPLTIATCCPLADTN
jgi:hypothetical protein